MCIYCHQEDEAITFESVPDGEVFMFNDSAYIKVRDSEQAVNLETGQLQHFGKFVSVTRVEAELDFE